VTTRGVLSGDADGGAVDDNDRSHSEIEEKRYVDQTRMQSC
jgi:hypothetical protein